MVNIKEDDNDVTVIYLWDIFNNIDATTKRKMFLPTFKFQIHSVTSELELENEHL